LELSSALSESAVALGELPSALREAAVLLPPDVPSSPAVRSPSPMLAASTLRESASPLLPPI
jgi:hypothetical protein